MSKQQRHQRKKIERARRTRALARHPTFDIGAAALAAAAAIAAGTSAYASPVRFDNPPGPSHFVWTTPPGDDVLDLLQDAASQPGTLGSPGTFNIAAYYGRTMRAGNSSGLQYMSVSGYSFLAGVDNGVTIPTAGFTDFTGGSRSAYIYSTYPYAPTTTLLSEGQNTYLGARFDLGSGYQYGWIGVVRTGLELDAFAWGYETDPGVPIAAGVPEPGTLALLALGAAGLSTHRRRRQLAN